MADITRAEETLIAHELNRVSGVRGVEIIRSVTVKIRAENYDERGHIYEAEKKIIDKYPHLDFDFLVTS